MFDYYTFVESRCFQGRRYVSATLCFFHLICTLFAYALADSALFVGTFLKESAMAYTLACAIFFSSLSVVEALLPDPFVITTHVKRDKK